MTLTIVDNVNIYDDEFIVYLIRQIADEFLHFVSRQKLHKWNEYLNRLRITEFGYKISAYEVLVSGIRNLVFDKTKSNEYDIFINTNAYIPYVKVSVATLCKLITYGNAEVQGYSVILDCFEYYKRNINKYYSKFMTMRLLCQ